MDKRKQSVLINQDVPIRESIRVIHDSGLAIALVVDHDRHLIGTVTDGDIRQGFLDGLTLDEPVAKVMHLNPITVSPETDMQTIRRLFTDASVKHIPVVDPLGHVLDIVLISDLLTVPLSSPDITTREIEAVLGVLQGPNLSLGPKIIEFEGKIAAYAHRKFAIAVNSGTSGLHLVVRSLGFHAGDEVITTPFSFIASSNCLLYENVTPVFVDIEPDTYNIDPGRIEAAITPQTRAILAVDVFGQPARYKAIESIANKYGLVVIADCCESIGAEHLGQRASTYGVAGVFAFYPNKQITTGEGGAVVTDDAELARLCRSMRNQGRGEEGGWLCHERLGFNYRLPEISCALGIVQLERIDEILERRQRIAETYNLLLKGIEAIHLPHIDPATTRMSWFVYVIRLSDRYTRADRDRILQYLRLKGIGANNYFPPIHLQPLYRERFGFKEGDFPIAEGVASRTIALPFHNNMTTTECEIVASHFRSALREIPADLYESQGR